MFGWKLAITCFLKQEKLRMSSRLFQMQIFKANNNKETKNQKSKCDSSKSIGTDGWWILPGLPTSISLTQSLPVLIFPRCNSVVIKEVISQTDKSPPCQSSSGYARWSWTQNISDTKYMRLTALILDRWNSQIFPLTWIFFLTFPDFFPNWKNKVNSFSSFFPDYQHS